MLNVKNSFLDITVEMPTAKAAISDIDVTVTDTPACFIVSAILTLIGSSGCFRSTRFQDSMTTNESSTPTADVTKEKI